MTCIEFWNNFWPNFASTVLGLLLGLPLALWTNRLFIKYQNREQRRNEQIRLRNALDVIRQTIIENKSRLKTTESVINGSQVQFDTLLDASTWEVVKSDINEFLHDSDLKKKIAYHFSRLNAFIKINDMYIDSGIGMASTLSHSQKTRDALRSFILKNINALLQSGDEILAMTQ